MSFYGSVQWEEEMEHYYGAQTELQNCLTEARQWHTLRNGEAWDKINALVAAGRFVIVHKGPAYCRATDALCGESVSCGEDFATRIEAETAAGLESITSMDDGEYRVYPLLPEPPRPRVAVDADDDLPF